MRQTKIWLAALLGLLGTFGVACTENRWDCRDICQTYQSCIAVNIDVSECTDQCTAFANTDSATESRAEQCNDCLDVNACSAAPRCAAVCDFIRAPID